MLFSERLKQVLKEKNITEYKLAKLSNMNRSTINTITHGNSKYPSSETLKKISKALNMTVSELLGETPTQDYLEGKTDNPNTVIEQINDHIKIAVHKDHVGEYSENDLKLALEIIELFKKHNFPRNQD